MTPTPHPIPARLNLALTAALPLLAAALWALPVVVQGRFHGLALVLGAAGFALLAQSIFALAHEAMHDGLHPRRAVNDAAGTLLSAFIPTSFSLVTHVHRAHHASNRSKRERIEYVAEGESAFAKGLLFYAILFGLNWLGLVLQNVVFMLVPRRVVRALRLDRDFGQTLPRLSDEDLARVRWESVGVLAAHAAVVALTPVTLAQWAAYFGAAALVYSHLRYLYHYESSFDVVEGAYDLRAPRWLSLALLNGTYHLTHHRQPRVPWVHLPAAADPATARPPFFARLVRQYRGVMPEAAQPARDGKVISWNGDSVLPGLGRARAAEETSARAGASRESRGHEQSSS